MVIELLAALGVPAGVVNLAPARRAIKSRVRGHVGLEPDDRSHVVLATRLVKVDDAVQIAVVGNGDGALTVRFGG